MQTFSWDAGQSERYKRLPSFPAFLHKPPCHSDMTINRLVSFMTDQCNQTLSIHILQNTTVISSDMTFTVIVTTTKMLA